MTTLVAGNVRYTPTAEDILWLRRAVQAEGQPRDLVAQTLVNGFMWQRHDLGSHRTLAEWVQAYAQPVNPRWMPGGVNYEDELARADTTEKRNAVVAKGWQRQHVHATQTAFSDDTVRAVDDALRYSPTYPEAIDYAAPDLEHASPWKRWTGPVRGFNSLWTRPAGIGWPGYSVDHNGGVWFALVVGAGAFAYLLWRGMRHV